MFACSSCNKKSIVFIIFFFLIVFISFKPGCFAFAESDEQELSDSLDSTLNQIDFEPVDEFAYDATDGDLSFEMLVKNILHGDYFNDYNSLSLRIKSVFAEYFGRYLRFFISLIIIVILFLLFKFFCVDRSSEMLFCMKIIFSFLIASILASCFSSYCSLIKKDVDDVCLFISSLFPIMLSVITLSGATTTATVFNAFSVFLINTGSYVLKFVLLPLAISILILSIFVSLFSSAKISKLIDICKIIFKYTIIIFVGAFGLLSSISLVSSSVSDGINLKLTKFAIKNYVPILGGYVSDGFDFVRNCSVLIKNAIGVTAIFVLILKIFEPLVLTIIFVLGFKIVSAVSSFVGDNDFSDMFSDVSNSFSNFFTIIVGLFLLLFIFIFLLVLSVGVV